MRFFVGMIAALIFPLAAAGQPVTLRYKLPSTISPEAASQLGAYYKLLGSATTPNRSEQPTNDEWDKQAAAIEKISLPLQQSIANELGVHQEDGFMGGVKILSITPNDYKNDGKLLIYVHGGAYVFLSSRSAISTPALLSAASGYKIISIDYTLAPHGNWVTITDQVIAVWKALLANGMSPQSIGLFGDSAGGGLAAGSVLKMRDLGLPLPAALFLGSPWADITQTGDTYETLKDADPILQAPLTAAANAYAEPKYQKQPYVSPVYGDYTKAFPPTLIQGGTREVFLSNFVRQYQAIRGGGHEAILDLYEGMPHVFQSLAWRSPEARTAVKREAEFFHNHLRP